MFESVVCTLEFSSKWLLSTFACFNENANFIFFFNKRFVLICVYSEVWSWTVCVLVLL